ncbi:hypothetical protein U1Q18_031386 [Sarracenia purpurea var. burkii]
MTTPKLNSSRDVTINPVATIGHPCHRPPSTVAIEPSTTTAIKLCTIATSSSPYPNFTASLVPQIPRLVDAFTDPNCHYDYLSLLPPPFSSRVPPSLSHLTRVATFDGQVCRYPNHLCNP